MPLTLEKTMKLCGYKERSPENAEELNTLIPWTKEFLKEEGEDWIKNHQLLIRDQWEHIIELGL